MQGIRRGLQRLGIGLAAATAGVSQAQAGGFYLQEQSAAGVGRAHAGNVAIADDASTIYYNPAGMTELKRSQVTVGADIIIPNTRLTDIGSTNQTAATFQVNPQSGGITRANGSDGGNPVRTTPIPHLYISRPLANSKVAVGLGITAPFGLLAKYSRDFFARYDSLTSLLITMDVAPSVAWKPMDWLSIGGGLDLQYAHVKLSAALPSPFNPTGPSVATDGTLTVRATNWATGFNLGVLMRLDAEGMNQVGISYRSGISHNFEGTATFEGLSLLLANRNGVVNATSPLRLPYIIQGGVRSHATEKLTLLGEVDYYGWRRYTSITINLKDGSAPIVAPQNYRNSWSAAVGAEYSVHENVRLTAGLKYDQTPTIDATRDTRVPDGSKYWISTGIRLDLAPKTQVDIGYAHVFAAAAPISISRPFYATTTAPAAAVSKIIANARTKLNLFSIGATYKF